MHNYTFKISARLMNHLGEALISDELVALLELIKNSYDADANKAVINIDTNFHNENGQGKIEVIDDGNGMSLEVIENSFLKLATDYKVKIQKISPKFKRMSLGNKGVGRLSLQRLGDFVVVTTNDGLNEYSLEIDWLKFTNDVDIQDIKIAVKENTNHILNSSGTKIEIFGLKNIEFWKSRDTFAKLRKEIIAMINPYANDESKFSISFQLDASSFNSDKYDVKLIETLADSTVNFKYNSMAKTLVIKVDRKRKYADYRINDAKKRYESMGFDFKELDQEARYDNLSKEYNIDIEHISRSYPKLFNDILIKDSFGVPYLPGDFEGRYFAFDKSPTRFTLENRAFLDQINGVKLFRNNFRILPYGNKNLDWLDFTKYSQTYSSNIYKLHSVAGYIYINGEENLNKLREMTNRQGLLEDNYGKNFLIILRDIISRIIVDSDVEFRNDFVADIKKIKAAKEFDEIYFKKGKILIIKQQNVAERLKLESKKLSHGLNFTVFDSPEVNDCKKNLQGIANSIRSDAAKIQNEIQSEKNRINEEEKILSKYKIAVANSIVAESLAHEILKITLKTKNYAQNIRRECSKPNFSQKNIDANVDMIIASMQFLERSASILDSNSYIKKNKFEVVDIKELLDDIINTFPLFDSEIDDVCKIDLSGDSLVVEIIKNNFVVSIENLLVNSKYWLQKNEIKNPCIHIETVGNQIVFYDNGYGISKDVEDNLFDAFVTSKPDAEGRGLGLYITNQLINEINGSISLSDERNSFGNKYKFIIRF